MTSLTLATTPKTAAIERARGDAEDGDARPRCGT